MKKLFPLLISITCFGAASAQTSNDKAIQALKTLMYNYTKNQGLSFDMRFTYATESRPNIYLDSLSGSVKLDGLKSWYLIDSTESLNTGEYLITVFREDKLLFLAKPTSGSLPQGTGLSSMNELWLNNLDSLVRTQQVLLEWKEDKDQQQVLISYPEVREYRSMAFMIDRKTGLLKSSVTVARNSSIEPERRIDEKNADEFAIITTQFLHYTRGKLKAGLFDSSRYFIRKGDEYIGVNEFKDYKVFLGTPGM